MTAKHPMAQTPESLPDMIDWLGDRFELMPGLPFMFEAAKILHDRLRGGAAMVTFSELVEEMGGDAVEKFTEVLAATGPLVSSSRPIVSVVGIDKDGSPISDEEFSHRLATGEKASETWLAYTPTPLLLGFDGDDGPIATRSVTRAQHAMAEMIYDEWDFGDLQVEAADGWFHDGWSRIERSVYVETKAQDTERCVFAIEFRPGSWRDYQVEFTPRPEIFPSMDT